MSVLLVLILACILVLEIPVSAAVTCKDLYTPVKTACPAGAGKVSEKNNCTFLSYSLRKKVDDFYYACDSDQIYCVCIVKAGSTSDAKKIYDQFKTIQADKANDSYLKASEKKTVKAAKYGKSGNYAWYICLGSKTQNKNAEKALKKKL